MTLESLLESILFAHGEPMAADELAAATGQTHEEVRAALGRLKESRREAGIVLIEHNGSWQLGSHPETSTAVEKFARDSFSGEISQAGLETLAVIAYRGPVSKTEIDYTRGVNSAFTLRALAMRGLIEETPNSKAGQPRLWTVSIDFLKHLGLTSLERLPEYQKFRAEQIDVPTNEA